MVSATPLPVKVGAAAIEIAADSRAKNAERPVMSEVQREVAFDVREVAGDRAGHAAAQLDARDRGIGKIDAVGNRASNQSEWTRDIR